MTYPPILIGGPARCGKSSLALLYSNIDSKYASLKVDALFYKYFNYKKVENREDCKIFLSEYLLRPRFIDPAKEKMAKPIDDFDSSIEQVVDKLYKNVPEFPITLINGALDVMAKGKQRLSWLALDLHAELHFSKLKRSISDLQLLILLRDPVEAVTASLYWRTYPQRISDNKRFLIYFSMLWNLSVVTAHNLKNRYHNEISILTLDELKRGEKELPGNLSSRDYLRSFNELFERDTYFSFYENKGFYCPDKKYNYLLNEEEIEYIKYVAKLSGKLNYAPDLKYNSISDFTFFYKISLLAIQANKLIITLNPLLAKNIIDVMFFPIRELKRNINKLKMYIRNNPVSFFVLNKLNIV